MIEIQDDPKRGLEWSQIIVSSIMTALLSLIVALLIWYLTKERPKLSYEVFPISSFVSEKTELGILNVKVENYGSKEAENIICVFSFSKGTEILEVNVEPSSNAMNYNELENRENYKKIYSIPLINEKENLKFSFLVKNVFKKDIV